MAYTRDVPEEDKKDYVKLKEALLTSLGMALPQYEEEFFRQEKKNFLSWHEASHHVVFTLNRLVQDCTTLDEFVTTLAISRLYNWVSPECVSHVRLQNPKTTTLISEYIRMHRDRRREKMIRRYRCKILKKRGVFVFNPYDLEEMKEEVAEKSGN